MYGNIGVAERLQFTVIGAPPTKPRGWPGFARRFVSLS